MRVDDLVRCAKFPCDDVWHPGYQVPGVEIDPRVVRIVLISEAAPVDPGDHYYAPGEPFFAQTTIQAFQDAGAEVHSVAEILDRGVYMTTAVKCAKTGYGLKAGTISECSRLLEAELGLFPDVQALLLMGDVAIKGVNAIARRNGEPRPIPAGSTYKLRGEPYRFRGMRVFPSYLQAGPAFFVEKSKRRMIAEDLAAALALAS
jgi:uracil-DNA glycosylase